MPLIWPLKVLKPIFFDPFDALFGITGKKYSDPPPRGGSVVGRTVVALPIFLVAFVLSWVFVPASTGLLFLAYVIGLLVQIESVNDYLNQEVEVNSPVFVQAVCLGVMIGMWL